MTAQGDLSPMNVPKKTFAPVLFSLLTLISGVLIGAGLMYLGMQRQMPKKPEPGPEYFSERTMRHLAAELKLSPEQVRQIDPIIKKHFESMHQVRMDVRPKIAEEIKQMNQAIQAILTEPQQQKWQEQSQRIREFPRDGFGPGRGPGTGQWHRGPEGSDRRPEGPDSRMEGQDRRPLNEDPPRDRRRMRKIDPNQPDPPFPAGTRVTPGAVTPPAEPIPMEPGL